MLTFVPLAHVFFDGLLLSRFFGHLSFPFRRQLSRSFIRSPFFLGCRQSQLFPFFFTDLSADLGHRFGVAGAGSLGVAGDARQAGGEQRLVGRGFGVALRAKGR